MGDQGDPNLGAVVPVPPQPPPVRVEVNVQGMTTTYANFFRVAGSFEELFIDFGLHTGISAGGQPEPVRLQQRVVLNFATAKRLLAALHGAVQRHESVFGPIEVDPHQKARRS